MGSKLRRRLREPQGEQKGKNLSSRTARYEINFTFIEHLISGTHLMSPDDSGDDSEYFGVSALTSSYLGQNHNIYYKHIVHTVLFWEPKHRDKFWETHTHCTCWSPTSALNSTHTDDRVIKIILFFSPSFNQSMFTFTMWLLVLLWIWEGRQKAQVFAASVSHLTALVIRESFCSASEWANITFESMWCLFTCFSSKEKKCWWSGYKWGGSVKSEDSVTHKKPWQRGLYRGEISVAHLELSESGCVCVGSGLDPLWQSGVSDAVLWKVHRLEFT